MAKAAADNNNDSRMEREGDEDQGGCGWGTWEELLLACAVKRHGLDAWESVAMEVQTRSSLPHPLTTADSCQLKYHDLRRRFSHHHHDDPSQSHSQPTISDDPAADKAHVPWLEELRKLRVAELRQEVQRRDLSILSLQLKVKKLEEEREERAREKQEKPDLGEDSKDGRSSHTHDDQRSRHVAVAEPDTTAVPAGKSEEGGEDSDRENRSVNESNSTGVKSERDKTGGGEEEEEDEVEGEGEGRRGKEDEPVRTGTGSSKTDQEMKPEGVDSYNGSSEPNRGRRGAEESEESEAEEEVEGEGEGERPESKENSSDVQSSASLTNKTQSSRRRKGRRLVEISGEPPGTDEGVRAPDSSGEKSSQPLVDLMKMIRSHKHCSSFDRLQQEDEKYAGIVRQHMDLEVIQSRLEKGSYSSSSLSFHRDLLLLFTNALVLFPKSSPESVAARELHHLISSDLKKKATPMSSSTHVTDPSPPMLPQLKPELERSDSLLAKHKSSAPIIVCRKRSSMSSKPTSATFAPRSEPRLEERKSAPDTKPATKPATSSGQEQNLIKMNARDKSVTGARSLRRSHKDAKSSAPPPTPAPSKKQSTAPASTDRAENSNSKTDQSKGEASASTKKRSAADFLKRIKRNSPVGKSKNSASDSSKNSRGGGGGSGGGGASNGGADQKKKQQTGKAEKGEDRGLRQSGSASIVKQAKDKEESSPSKRNVGRPPKKGSDSNVRQGRDAGGKEATAPAALKRPRKRARR